MRRGGSECGHGDGKVEREGALAQRADRRDVGVSLERVRERAGARDGEFGPGRRFGARVALERVGVAAGGERIAGLQRGLDRVGPERVVIVRQRAAGEQRLAFREAAIALRGRRRDTRAGAEQHRTGELRADRTQQFLRFVQVTARSLEVPGATRDVRQHREVDCGEAPRADRARERQAALDGRQREVVAAGGGEHQPGDLVGHHLRDAVPDAASLLPDVLRPAHGPGKIAEVEVADRHHVAVQQGEVRVVPSLTEFDALAERAPRRDESPVGVEHVGEPGQRVRLQ